MALKYYREAGICGCEIKVSVCADSLQRELLLFIYVNVAI